MTTETRWSGELRTVYRLRHAGRMALPARGRSEWHSGSDGLIEYVAFAPLVGRRFAARRDRV